MLTPEQANKEADRRLFLDTAATIGGTVGGAALGTLLINPMEYFNRRKAERAAMERHENFVRNQEILSTINDLHKGKLSWDDITDEARPHLEQLYAENRELFEGRDAAIEDYKRRLPHNLAVHPSVTDELFPHGTNIEAELAQQAPGEIVRFPRAPKGYPLREFLPPKQLLQHPIAVLSHPIPATLGLIGAGLAGYAMDRHHQRRLFDALRQQHAEGGDDLA